jgi:hypothetical protein
MYVWLSSCYTLTSKEELLAKETDFDHDQLGHLLADHLLEVPRYQRSYAWEAENVEEFLDDLAKARAKGVSYFVGTTVFANSPNSDGRLQVVDGQQRLATTSVLLIAIRDLLSRYGKNDQAEKMAERYLKGYVLSEEREVERLILSPKNQRAYDLLMDGEHGVLDDSDPILTCYKICLSHLEELAPTAAEYQRLMEVSAQLEKDVQVLVATASDLSEAYVIFETLNDRGADLTTADLLKNFLFSQAGPHMRFFEENWVSLETNFDKPDDLVKFIRYEYASRHGAVSTRKLYRAIQEDLTQEGADAKGYLLRLADAQKIYLALRDPDNQYWSDVQVDVRDALLAYRRFGFESSIPVLLAAFLHWRKSSAAKLLVKMSQWSVRSLFAGKIGARLSEDAFGQAAVAISSEAARTQADVRSHLNKLIPTDTVFKAAFCAFGPVAPGRAKYLLAMLEKANSRRSNKSPRLLDWASNGINIEHVLSQHSAKVDDSVSAVVDEIGNLALLEKKLNRDLGDMAFGFKREAYAGSDFALTKNLAQLDAWDVDAIQNRTAELASIACIAWPHR